MIQTLKMRSMMIELGIGAFGYFDVDANIRKLVFNGKRVFHVIIASGKIQSTAKLVKILTAQILYVCPNRMHILQ